MPRASARDPLTTRAHKVAQERVTSVTQAAEDRVAAVSRATEDRVAAMGRATEERVAAMSRAAEERVASATRAAEEGLSRLAERRDQVTRALRPGRRSRPVLEGWSISELAAYLDNPRVTPPRRAGHAAVALTNAMGGLLPLEGTLLARAVADAAPPLGHEISATLLDILERYLPDTLIAFRNSGMATATEDGQRLVVDQLRLLHQVTRDVQRAEAEHDDHELRVHEAFLRERFATASNTLDLGPAPGAPRPTRPPARNGNGAVDSVLANGLRRSATPAAPSTLAASQGSHHRLHHVTRPTAIFHPDVESDGLLHLRMALPKGLRLTLGVVYETRAGAIRFRNAMPKRFAAKRRQAGFDAAQVDVGLDVPLADVRRFAVHVGSKGRGQPIETVMFATEGSTNSAELPTVLTHHPRAGTTVVATGHDTSEGLFIRNESRVFGTLRGACDGYGYCDVTWISNDTPAV